MALSLPDGKQCRPLNGAVTRRIVAGAAGSLGQCVYYDSDGEAQPAYAGNVVATAARGRGIVVASDSLEMDGTYEAGAMLTVVTSGPVSGFDGATEGAEVYVSPTTAGEVTQTKPSAAGHQVMSIGYMESATILYVMPQTIAPVSGA